ncbi:MAG: alpha/beta hydrolase-fold protein, partial [Planctomycetota bacterium]|nr:alpha/beta hydrolase-fold protein [Planctomycetota bacterium]
MRLWLTNFPGGSLSPLLLTVFTVLLMSDEIKSQIVSPEVNGKAVTFRLRAPRANEVSVVGISGRGKQRLEKGAGGIWTLTLNNLEPELYSYSFEVDGTRMLDPSNRRVKKWLTCNSLFEVRGGLLHEKKPVPHGELREIIYDSKTTGTQRNALVYTPPGHDGREAEWPVLFLLHGYGDDHLAWKEVGRAQFILDNLIAEKKIRPCVVVMPYGHPLSIDLKQEFDDYADRNIRLVEKDLLEDLVPLVRKKFGASASRDQNAIVGLSMGGGQSLGIGLRHPGVFSRVGGFSSAAAQGTDEEIARQFPDLQSTEKASHKLASLWFACGRDDFLFERNNRFSEWLKNRGVDHTYHVSEGGHDWMVW